MVSGERETPEVVVAVRDPSFGPLTLIRSDLTREEAGRFVMRESARGRECTVTYPSDER